MTETWTTKKVDKYIIVNKKLGSGTYGTVYRGFLAEDESQQVAVKTIPIKVISDTPKMLELIKREIAILKKLNHQNIVQLCAVSRSNNYLYMFLEYCEDSDLKEFTERHEEKRLSEIESVIFMKHIIEGFKVLYKAKIIHRDIKPANILLHKGVAKITDFGFARVIETEMNDPAYFSRLGSPLYMAPQILEGQPFSAKCDIWSLGILFYEILYGKTPWYGENAFTLLKQIKSQQLIFPLKPVRSQKVKELIKRMLVFNEKERISWDEVFESPIVKIEEQRIKENLERILKEKDIIHRSISLNKLYMESNLVIGYLNNPGSQIRESLNEENPLNQSNNSNLCDDLDHNGEEIINNYAKEKKKREIIKKYMFYFLYERNIAFFFNFVLQRIVQVQASQQFNISQDFYFKLIFLLVKNQMIHLEKVNQQINQKDQDKFDKVQWGSFLASQEYLKIQNIINQDIQHTKDFFCEIMKRTQDVHKLADVSIGSVKNFMEVLNSQFQSSDIFQEIYRFTILDTMKQIKLVSLQTKDTLLCLLYLSICLNPYEIFHDIHHDFNKFYEDTENLTLEEIKERLVQKQKKKEIK